MQTLLPTQLFATGYSVFLVVTTLFGSFGPVLGGLLIDRGAPMGAVIAAFAVVGYAIGGTAYLALCWKSPNGTSPFAAYPDPCIIQFLGIFGAKDVKRKQNPPRLPPSHTPYASPWRAALPIDLAGSGAQVCCTGFPPQASAGLPRTTASSCRLRRKRRQHAFN